MKRISIVVALILACAAAITFYGRRPKEGLRAPALENATEPSSSVSPKATRPSEVVSQSAPRESEVEYTARMKAQVESEITKNPYPEYARRYLEQRRADPRFDWKQPIDFYGKVVDEKGQSIEGASVQFSWNDLSENGTSRATSLSDANGLFSLNGKQGKRLSVSVSKDGYHRPPVAWIKSFEYADPFEANFHRPDAGNPVIFQLKKKGELEPMIQGQKLFGSPVDGNPSYIDLAQGKKSNTTGDLAIRMSRGERDANRHFDWTVTVEVPEGGLIESTEEFMFHAPEGGYRPKFEFAQRATDPNWTSQIKRNFYVKSRGGKMYSRIEVTFIPRYNDSGAIDIQYFVNPSGSRNLEYDPAVQNRQTPQK